MPMNAEPDDVFEGKRRELTSGAGVAQGCRAEMSRGEIEDRRRVAMSGGGYQSLISTTIAHDVRHRSARQ